MADSRRMKESCSLLGVREGSTAKVVNAKMLSIF